MANIVKSIQEKQGFVAFTGVSPEQIELAQAALGVKFAKEYREYVSAYGAASFENHELTGICASPRLNVVDVTEAERLKYPDPPKDWYVVEQLNIDDVSIWQAGTGEVYQLLPGAQPIKLSDSLSEYIAG